MDRAAIADIWAKHPVIGLGNLPDDLFLLDLRPAVYARAKTRQIFKGTFHLKAKGVRGVAMPLGPPALAGIGLDKVREPHTHLDVLIEKKQIHLEARAKHANACHAF